VSSSVSTTVRPAWWARPGLDVVGGRLRVAGRDAEQLARTHRTPLYVYDLQRVREQAIALQDALTGAGLEPRVRLALKAQREPALLNFLRHRAPFIGVDVCSPGEIEWALEHGWMPSEVSYTGTNLSERDLDAILGSGVHLNVDLLTQLQRVGRRGPGRAIGIRINPRIGASFGGEGSNLYTGERPTKFGIFPEQLNATVDLAREYGMEIDTVHVHVGDGYLTEQLPVFEETMRRVAAATRRLKEQSCPIVEVNTGGGLGVPQRPGDEPLDLDRWATILAEQLGPLDVPVGVEPGDFLVKECAVLLAEVVTVEVRDGTTFAGIDVGWNAMCEHFVYGALLDVVLCRAGDAPPAGLVTVSGHINEGNDLFAEDQPLPAVAEGDILAAINVGSYNASQWSNHCLRPPAEAVAFEDRIA